MGYPAENFEGIYRNSLKDVKRYIEGGRMIKSDWQVSHLHMLDSSFRFFDSRFKDHYKIYNLYVQGGRRGGGGREEANFLITP